MPGTTASPPGDHRGVGVRLGATRAIDVRWPARPWRSTAVNRALRAATMGVLLLSPVALTACSAGQVPQTATQNRDKVGPEAAVGDVTLRAITLAYPQDGRYAEGDDAELQMAIVNGGTEADTLVGIEGETFDGVVVSGQATASPSVPGSPVTTTPATPTTPGATPAPGTTPD